MAEKKKIVRKFVSASDGSEIASAAEEKTKKIAKKAKQAEEAVAEEPEEEEQAAPVPKTRKQKASSLRAAAVILWILAIAAEVFAILVLTYKIIVPDKYYTYFIIGAIVLDLILVVIGSFLWKHSNRLDPVSKKNKLKFFLWNQMGLIVAIVAFVPLIVLLIKNNKLDPKSKKLVTIIAAVALVLAALLSVDYNPVSQEDIETAQADSVALGDGTAYWTPWGRSYHFDPDCQTLQNSKEIIQGTVEQAFEAHRTDPCDFCALTGSEETTAD